MAPALEILVAGICLALGTAAGYVMHRSDYCLAGTFRDPFLFGNTFMVRALALCVAASMVLFEGARLLGALPSQPLPFLRPPSLASLLGGFLFGVGMVLAGGCVVGTLYKMGSGSAPSLVAFGGLVAGSALYAEFHPAWSRFARATEITGGAATLPGLVHLPPLWFVVAASAGCAALFLRWRRAGLWVRAGHAEGYLQPWLASLLLAAIGTLSYCVAGMPLGVTTLYAKMAAWAEHLVAPSHLASVSYFASADAGIRVPWTGFVLGGGPGPQVDGLAIVEGPAVSGIILGSLLSSLLLGEFHVRFRIPARQYAAAFTGGAAMALASRMASGCNVWHLLGGLPVFALSSLLFTAGLVPGAWAGTRLLTRIILPSTLAGATGPAVCSPTRSRP